MISLKRLIKAIFLLKGIKGVFLAINRIKYLRLLIIRFFKEKISKNHTSLIFLSRGEVWYFFTQAVILYLCGTLFYTVTLVIISHISAIDLLLISALL